MKKFILSCVSAATLALASNAMAFCPSGYTLASLDNVRQQASDVHKLLDQWDIVRLSRGASMKGSGYAYGTQGFDGGQLGNTLCKKPIEFRSFSGDSDQACPKGYSMVSYGVADQNRGAISHALGQWVIARLKSNAAVSGYGHGNSLERNHADSLGDTLCAKYEFLKVDGDEE